MYDKLFIKESGTINRTRWHNDQPYWPVSGKDILSIWVALDKTTRENGRLEFIRGSHLWNISYQPETFGETFFQSETYQINPQYEKIPDIEASRSEYNIVGFDLELGDVYVFHALTLHGSGGNTSNTSRRRGYAVRYTGDDARYSTRKGSHKSLRNSKLKNGDVLDSDQYPVVLS